MAYENYGVGVLGTIRIPGAPSAGVNAIQTLTIGGTPTGGSFRLSLGGIRTGPIGWSSINSTLLTNINGMLDVVFGTNQIIATAGTLTAGIGTILLTFSGANVGRSPQATMVVAENLLTGTAPTVAVATTTPGVAATGRGQRTGTHAIREDTGVSYINTGTPNAPVWTVTGSQT